MLKSTDEELRLLDLLQPAWWEVEARKRGFRGISLTNASLTESGVVATLQFDGRDALVDLERGHQKIRAMLDILDTDLSDISPSGRSSKVLFAIRTRYITDELDMFWHPGITTLGRDTVTGEEVDVPRNERILVGGASGSGKSWSTRSLMARAVVLPDEELAWFIDGKGEEATVWRGICRCAVAHEEIIEAIESAHAMMEDRAAQMAKLGLSKWDFQLGPRKLIVIDEGYSVLCAVIEEDKRRGKAPKNQDEEYTFQEGPDKPVMQKLTELSSQGRSREVILMWMTQNPLRTGDDRGITSGIRSNFDYSFCLRVNTPQNTTTVLGDGSGVEPHTLPRGTRFRGHGYLNVHGRNLIRTWTLTDDMVRLLSFPQNGLGQFPRDVALRTLRAHSSGLWTPELLASWTGAGTKQAACFLRSFAHEGFVKPEGEHFRVVI